MFNLRPVIVRMGCDIDEIAGTTIDILSTPTTLQRRAFELIGATIPHTLM